MVLTLTAVPISYRWASDAIYRLTGETPPAAQGPGGATGPAGQVSRPPAGTTVLAPDALLAAAAQAVPGWESLTLRLGSPARGPEHFSCEEWLPGCGKSAPTPSGAATSRRWPHPSGSPFPASRVSD
jgi:hypothetical protein